MGSTSPPEILTPQYMTRFACIGAECEDNCCHDWGVTLSKAEYTKLKKVLDDSPKGRDQLANGIKRTRGERQSEHGDYARLTHKDNGDCFFLSGGGLCSLHRDRGEAALPYVCSVFPRHAARIGAHRIEVTATLSCPEAARLCLWDADSMVLVDGDASLTPRAQGVATIDPEKSADPYAQYFDDVRAAVLGLLSAEGHSVAARLFFVAYLASRVSEFFHRDTTTFNEAQLAAELQRMNDPALLDELDQRFGEIEMSAEFGTRLIHSIIGARTEMGVRAAFAQLITNAYGTYAPDDGSDTVSYETVRTEYISRFDAWRGECGDLLDVMEGNYALNFWLKEWYTASPSLLAHTRRMLLSLSTIRFLTLSDPALQALDDADGETRRRALGDAAVRATYLFTRNIDHHESYLKKLEQGLDDAGVTSLAHMALLIRQ